MIVALILAQIVSGTAPPSAPPPTPPIARIRITPLHPISTRAALGKGKTAYLWSVDACNVNPTHQPITLKQGRIKLETDLPIIPNHLAATVVNFQVNNDPASILGTNGDAAVDMVSTVVTAGGVALKSKSASWVGAGIMVAHFFIKALIKPRVPAATVPLAELVPDDIAIAADSCAPTYFWVVSPVHNPRSQVLEIRGSAPGVTP